MKNIIQRIDKVFENRIRLGVMSALMVNDSLDFNSLKNLLGATDGNLSSNISILEQQKYLKVKKKFINKKSNTSFSITKAGRKAFQSHLDALEELFKWKSK